MDLSTGRQNWLSRLYTPTSYRILPAAPPLVWALPMPHVLTVTAPVVAPDLARPWPSRCSALCRCPCTYPLRTFYPRVSKSNKFSIPVLCVHSTELIRNCS